MKKNFYLTMSGRAAHYCRRLRSGTGKLASAGLLAATLFTSAQTLAQGNSTPAVRQMETLGRGIVAVDQGNGKVFVSWRLLATDDPKTAFDVYRKSASGTTTKLNTSPITASTNFVDPAPDATPGTTYYVNAVPTGGANPGTVPTNPETAPVWAQQYMRLPLQRPAGGTAGSGTTASAYTYSPNDCSVGDLDGDGQYEIIVKWDPSNAQDNSLSGFTGNVLLDAYKLDGTRLWRIDLGRNIRAGAHYTQFMVYDLDGDGKAEVACKTADATIDGTGQVLGDANADHRNTAGYVLRGPEYLTVFNGLTGAAYPSVQYLPQRHPDPTIGDNPTPAQMNTIWGDNYGNRIDRFLAAVAYLDGVHPSLVMCRGYYTRAVLVAWDFKNGQLTQRWIFDSNDGTPGNLAFRGQGNHNLSIADVDGDGKDEIVYGSCAVDDDGKGMYATGRGHGDAMHVSDLDPTRPGLEVFSVHETQSQYGSAPNDFRDARTGTLIWGAPGPNQGDVGRGMTMDLDPRTIGAESWSSRGGLYAANGTQISTARPSNINFAVWWDGDLLRESLDGTTINKWDWTTSRLNPLLSAAALGAASNNTTKATPNLSADLFGDWREEVIWRNANNEELLIFTTTIPTNYRLTTLMHDSHYRVSIAWQNVAYNQPPHTGFYLGDGMQLAATAPTSAVNLNAGGAAFSASQGTFEADQYYSDSSAVFTTTAPIAGTPNQALYQSERYSTNGQLRYAVPVTNGTYSVVLHFAETYWSQVGQRVFNIGLEGTTVRTNYDIVRKVGPLTATTETFTVQVTDGVLNLDLVVPYLSGGADQAKLSALEVRLVSTTYRLNAGGAAQPTALGTFAADQYYSTGSAAFTTASAIAGTDDDALYQSERYSTNGQLSYALPVANGTYSVVLHFAETYWTQVGQRVFNIGLEGTTVRTNYDIVAKVGPLTATTETFVVTVTDGVLNVDLRVPYLSGGADQAKLSALEVLPVTSSARPLAARSASTSSQSALSVYPNPTPDGHLTIKYAAATAQEATLTLINPLGQVVQQQALRLQPGVNQLPVQLERTRPGLYQLVLRTTDGQRLSEKVLVQP